MPSTVATLPPVLREGDRLSSAEFLRRWDVMPELKQAELIDGVVFMASPVGNPHATAHCALSAWLWLYQDATPGCEGGTEATVIMRPGSVPQPDVFLRILPEWGGQSTDEGAYVCGAPELVVEISGSTLSRDLGIKLDLYRKAGVREYLTILLNPRQVIWRRLVRARYQEIQPSEDGILRSHVFPGLWLDPEAVWNPKLSMRTTLELGLKTPEHDAFLQWLEKQRAK